MGEADFPALANSTGAVTPAKLTTPFSLIVTGAGINPTRMYQNFSRNQLNYSEIARKATLKPAMPEESAKAQYIKRKFNFDADETFYYDFDTKKCINIDKDGTISNVAVGLLADQFGMVAMVSFLRSTKSTINNFSGYCLEKDLLTIIDLYAPPDYKLYEHETSVYNSLPLNYTHCEQVDVPDEYRVSKRLPAKFYTHSFTRFGDEVLFHIFYCRPSEICQNAAAYTLICRGWKYHNKLTCWTLHEPVPTRPKDVSSGFYHYFDPHTWRKKRVDAKYISHDYSDPCLVPPMPICLRELIIRKIETWNLNDPNTLAKVEHLKMQANKEWALIYRNSWLTYVAPIIAEKQLTQHIFDFFGEEDPSKRRNIQLVIQERNEAESEKRAQVMNGRQHHQTADQHPFNFSMDPMTASAFETSPADPEKMAKPVDPNDIFRAVGKNYDYHQSSGYNGCSLVGDNECMQPLSVDDFNKFLENDELEDSDDRPGYDTQLEEMLNRYNDMNLGGEDITGYNPNYYDHNQNDSPMSINHQQQQSMNMYGSMSSQHPNSQHYSQQQQMYSQQYNMYTNHYANMDHQYNESSPVQYNKPMYRREPEVAKSGGEYNAWQQEQTSQNVNNWQYKNPAYYDKMGQDFSPYNDTRHMQSEILPHQQSQQRGEASSSGYQNNNYFQ